MRRNEAAYLARLAGVLAFGAVLLAGEILLRAFPHK
jgi:hypothetical protein